MFYPQKRVLPTLGLVQEVLCQSARALTEQAYGLPPRLSEKDLEWLKFSARVFMRAGGSVALVASEDSHFFLWAACVEYLTEVLIRVPESERDLTIYILGATWRLLPEYRLRQIRVCLIRL